MSSQNTFRCDYPACNASYRRKEHLNRHKAQHLPQQSAQCPVCGRVFGRNDTLRRHVRQRHPEDELMIPTRQACVNCRNLKSRCEGGPPCTECLRRRIPCSLHGQPKRSERDHNSGQIGKPDRPVKTQDFLELYFQRFHRHWPFVHRGSFNPSNETPLLVQSMAAIGMWVSNVPKTQSAAIDLHQTLNEAIYQQRDKWDASIADNVSSRCTWPIAMYQAILLHIIFSLVSGGSTPVGLDLKPLLPDIEAGLLTSLVRSCRKLGMFQYRNILARYKAGDLPTFVWVGVEEVKRFVLALYRVCSALSCDGHTFNLGECTGPGELSWSFPASELQFPLPTHDLLWDARGREEWMPAAEDVDCIDLGDMMESEWISKSANILQLV